MTRVTPKFRNDIYFIDNNPGIIPYESGGNLLPECNAMQSSTAKPPFSPQELILIFHPMKSHISISLEIAKQPKYALNNDS